MGIYYFTYDQTWLQWNQNIIVWTKLGTIIGFLIQTTLKQDSNPTFGIASLSKSPSFSTIIITSLKILNLFDFSAQNLKVDIRQDLETNSAADTAKPV